MRFIYIISVLLWNMLIAVGHVHALVLNEIMYNPDGDENTDEFIELYNETSAALSLDNWRITDGADTDKIYQVEQELIAQPGQHVIILDPDYFEDQSSTYDGLIPEEALVVTIDNTTFGERGLSNSSSERVSLLNPQGISISAYAYTVGNDQGHSEEKILPLGGDTPSNWADAFQYNGTPGTRNSVTPPAHDLCIANFAITPPDPQAGESALLRIFVSNAGIEPAADTLRLSEWLLPDEGESLIPLRSWITAMIPAGDTIPYEYNWEMPDNAAHAFVAALSQSDDRPGNDEMAAAIGMEIPGLVINEIMYDPEPNRCEWIEIENAGLFAQNVRNWHFADGSGITDSSRRIVFPDFVIPRNNFALVASDSTIYFEGIADSVPIVVMQTDQLSFNNSGDSLVLYNASGQLADRVDYRPTWGNGQQGISLERISAASASDDPLNWASSVDSTGATPGRINSRTGTVDFGEAKSLLELLPNPFSPNDDGHDDMLLIRFKLNESDSRVDIRIFDIRGREIRRLADNESTSYTGERSWDGKDSRGHDAPTGLYIIYLEALGKGGTRIQSAKRVAALARPT